YSLSLQGRRVLRRRTLVLHRVHADLSQFVGLATLLKVIAPDARLRFKGQPVLYSSAEVAFFAVNIGRDPISRHQIQAPAIHVEEKRIPPRATVRSIQTHNVKILILNPDAPQEAASARVLLRRN